MNTKEEVILVNEKDEQIGTMEKLEAHEKGVLHRAFSVFIFNEKGEMLLQRRAHNKYHSAGLLTNTCCSHPRPGEDTLSAAHRRLREEMGMEAQLEFKTTFIYRTPFDNQLTEHELDHVFFGHTDQEPKINTSEVDGYQWEEISAIRDSIRKEPSNYTSWFRIAMDKLFSSE